MKKCQYCNEEIQDDALKCRFCGEWLNKESQAGKEPVSVEFPKIWPGYIIGLIALVLQIFQLSIGPLPSNEFGSKMVVVIALSVALWLAGFAYWCICLYKIHKNILKIADGQYPISPARAVGFGFVPFYNFYWMFKWPSEAINFINTRDKSKKLSTWVAGLVLLLSSLSGILLGFIWFIGSFGVLSYLSGALKRNLAVQPQATPYKTRPTPFPVWVIAMLVCIPVLFIVGIAAIAIPNFTRVSGTAKAAVCRANLAAIDMAKKLWELDTGAQADKALAWPDLVPNYIKEKPVCLKGGTYEIGNVDSPATCSIADNGTKNPADDHVLNR